jgi:hypothetical protein
MEKIGRNDPCHCGSGKKYKNCHEKLGGSVETRKTGFIIGAVVVLLIILAIVMITIDSQSTATNGAPGPAPEGKVWSEAHGHWHDA